MKIADWLRKLTATSTQDSDTPGIPQSLKEFEKQYVRNRQDELNRTLQILELEVETVSRK